MRNLRNSLTEALAEVVSERIIRPRVRMVALDVGLLSLGFVVLGVALAALAAALYLLLARAMDPWLAALLLGIVLLAVGLGLLALVRWRTSRRSGSSPSDAGRPRESAANGDGEARPTTLLEEALSRTQMGTRAAVLTSLLAGVLMGVKQRPPRSSR